jgi:hypothetical protein
MTPIFQLLKVCADFVLTVLSHEGSRCQTLIVPVRIVMGTSAVPTEVTEISSSRIFSVLCHWEHTASDGMPV